MLAVSQVLMGVLVPLPERLATCVLGVALVAVVVLAIAKRWFSLGSAIVTVVLAVLVVLTVLPARSRVRTGWEPNSRSNLKTIGTALFMYANRQGDSFPASLDDVVVHLEGRECFNNLDSPETGYIYVLGLPPHTEIEFPPERIVMFEEKPFLWGRGHSRDREGYYTNVLFADGHVEGLPMTPAEVARNVIIQFGSVPVTFELVRESHSEPLANMPTYGSEASSNE